MRSHPAREAAAASEIERAAVAKAASEAAHELEPVSVFISRKTQRLYVRRGFEPILESPVAILDADRPIGTHVFTAVARTDTGLRWSVVALDNGRPAAVVEAHVEPVPPYASAAKARWIASSFRRKCGTAFRRRCRRDRP
jgi:hypothetical protein